MPIEMTLLRDLCASTLQATHFEGPVRVREVVTDTRPPIREFDPGHPDADDEGYVARPNVSEVTELSNLMSASRSFEANLLIVRKAREMGEAAMQIGR